MRKRLAGTQESHQTRPIRPSSGKKSESFISHRTNARLSQYGGIVFPIKLYTVDTRRANGSKNEAPHSSSIRGAEPSPSALLFAIPFVHIFQPCPDA